MSKLTRYSEFPVIESIRRDMDRIFDDLIPSAWRMDKDEKALGLWAPRTDMSETDDEYVVTVDLPGISKKEIEVNYQNNRLTISGERKKEEKEEKKDFIRKERYEGRFLRSFTLPTKVKDDDIKASFQDGVLTVHVPKAEVSKQKKVTIT
ncbi:Hsp20/alpha crystallin family protein [Fodinibius sediminis]|uniref:HSP20 family protein n=1 Tax=Fodinibius sediminis TaxID=1214077 RepID=A0A521CUT1_9BACT|nr:Hsp20/alpha crystallin family protein [Fodinibius sediminis]SMO63224.1 HSP20 family protein [Fodinibius sediminis]